MFAKLLSLAALAAAANAEHWIFGGSRPIVTTRLDSIVNPNAVRPPPRPRSITFARVGFARSTERVRAYLAPVSLLCRLVATFTPSSGRAVSRTCTMRTTSPRASARPSLCSPTSPTTGRPSCTIAISRLDSLARYLSQFSPASRRLSLHRRGDCAGLESRKSCGAIYMQRRRRRWFLD
ncbi:hypothetical protein BD310DRAFT_268878 [Dichomitus squalens]|uniref:Uncharacterized protein n=1 Tax=Dichomitus squalens TaxID=114155 RepID=A0A4V2K8P9_9APHY|nr:hypothetical protein BD310DRAFT_268878 [Dichomitus squalens]